ncbi:heat shock 70 kDa protein 12B-like [Saccostrea cucullata]|uniref:heat shock 70 kDa protein 12B-like n=1 Tax=Saccostrea cuccullata TaxID=36930 RepID=UPI002ED2A635
MKSSFFRGFFKKTVDSIVKQLEELFAEDVVKDVKTILLVGDLSENWFVVEALKKNFEDKEVFVPKEGRLSAVKGAYFFSKIPEVISRRPSQYTYGFQSWPEFIPGHHLEGKKVKINGSVRCRDVFLKVVRKGENVMPGYTKAEILKIPNDEGCLKCCLFFTEMENTDFIDEPRCKLLGVLRLPLSSINDEASCEIRSSLRFGETELEFEVMDVSSGVQHKAIFDLYEH